MDKEQAHWSWANAYIVTMWLQSWIRRCQI